MRIIHTSDWHLGRIFHGIHMTEDQAYLMEQFVGLVKDSKADVVLVAGDIYDRSVPPVEAVNLLDEVLSKIILELKVPVIMISGNHDNPDRVHFGSRLLESSGLKIFGRFTSEMNPVVIEDSYGPVYFHPLPYVEPSIVRHGLEDDEIHTHDEAMQKLMNRVKDRIDKGRRNVLITHTFAAGGEASESERPLSIGGSSVVDASYFNDFNYVALGHLHRSQKVGSEHIRYSGSLMKYSFDEWNQKKHIPIVDLERDGSIHIEKVELKPRRDLRCIEGYIEDVLKGPQGGENKEDYIMVTLKDEGAILDPMGKIRNVYPNCLHIERPQSVISNNICGPDRNFRKIEIGDLFSSFFKEVTSSELLEDQRKMFDEIMLQSKILRGE